MLDRIYFASPSQLRLCDATKALALSQEGFVDTVVWNPGPDNGIGDLGEDEYRRFICIEPACIMPVSLPAGAEWMGLHRIRSTS
jgi:glucose-6-phosphate 1-epimerase